MQFGAQRAQPSTSPTQFPLEQVCLSVRLLLAVQRSTAPLDRQRRELIISQFIRRLDHVQPVLALRFTD
jgi:hypothetical protein